MNANNWLNEIDGCFSNIYPGEMTSCVVRIGVVVCAPIGTTTLVGVRGNWTLCMANCMCELENAPLWLLCSADGYMRVKKTARKQKRRTGVPSPNIGVNKIMHRMFTIIHCVWLRESEHWEPVLQQRSSCYALKSTYTTIGVYFVCRIFLNGERFLFYFYYFFSSLFLFRWEAHSSSSRDKSRHNSIASFDFPTIFLFFISYGIVSFSIRLFLLQISCFHFFFLSRIFQMNNA